MIKKLCAAGFALVLALGAAVPAWAHDPFDGTTELGVFDNKIEAKVTLGYDAARALLQAGKLPPAEVARMTRASPDGQLIQLPVALAPTLMTILAGPQPLAANAFMVAPGASEVAFLIVFPRAATSTVSVRAAYFDTVEYMRTGTLVAVDSQRRVLASALLSKQNPVADVPLIRAAVMASVNGNAAGFVAFFKLGVEHILTGFDHLLFLFALLVTVTRVGPMLGIVSAFTLGHSVTLALAALNVVALPSHIVEPLIAASIIVACVANLRRSESATGRYWIAGTFGLIHGFGFAGILRDTVGAQPGQGIVLPLLSFNLGVEAGQLMVAAVLIGLLVLLRRTAHFARFGVPALSACVIAMGTFWLLERTQLI